MHEGRLRNRPAGAAADAATAEAIEFGNPFRRRIMRLPRRALGLIAATALVVFAPIPSASADASDRTASNGSDEYWSTVMDRKTLAAMRHQEKFQPVVQELTELAAKNPAAGFTSLAFEGDGLSVYWKGNPPTPVQQAVTAARNKLDVKLRSAAYSMADMENFADRIAGAAAESDLQAISLNYDGSGIKITKKPPSRVSSREAKSGRSVRRAEDILSQVRAQGAAAGNAVAKRIPATVVTADHVIEPLACNGPCSRLDDSPAWNGGIRLVNRDSPKGWYECTSGFGTRQGNNYYLVTAAHCGHSSGDRYYDAAGEFIGTSCGEQSTLDIQVICAPGFYRMFDGPPGTTNYKNVLGWGYHVVNELLCHSGATSGVICGLKTIGGDYQVWGEDSDGDQFYVKGLIKTTQIDGQTGARKGDSGGPVFSLMGTGVRAKGTISAGGAGSDTMLFQDWADYLRQWSDMYPRTP
ncbi:hypothetical protein AB0G04_36070 [Actinoplanes sp. NPDC023801]|uniref:hypothetical protein n=1 Tax=Actinoplanes sp. NPDC023801 TaxID=3154595 RepID=UPI003410DB4B